MKNQADKISHSNEKKKEREIIPKGSYVDLTENTNTDFFIAEKLSSLESLPEGYNPNIEAKWSIIQQASSRKRVFGYKKWMGIAASILFLMGCFITWNYVSKPTTQDLTQNEQKNRIIVPVEQKSNEQFTVVTKVEKTLSNRPAKKIKQVKPEPPLMQNEIVKEEIIQTPAEQPNVDFASIVEPETQKNKQRYVEVNFNEPVRNDNNREKNVAHVKIKFDFKKDADPSANSENTSSLRIKQNF